MISLLTLGGAAGYIALWFLLYNSTRNPVLRVGAIVMALVIPFWDLPIGYLVYHRHCSTEGGLRVYQPIAPQDKLYFESTPSSYPEDILKQGFKVVEILRTDRKGILRQELQHGILISRSVSSPESPLVVSIVRNEKLTWNIYREKHTARALNDNKLIASYTAFSWYGGWLQDLTRPALFPIRERCSSGPDPLIAFLRHGTRG